MPFFKAIYIRVKSIYYNSASGGDVTNKRYSSIIDATIWDRYAVVIVANRRSFDKRSSNRSPRKPRESAYWDINSEACKGSGGIKLLQITVQKI